MANRSPIQITYSSQFERDIKHLEKKYRHIWQDVEDLISQLENGETPGDQIQGVNLAVYKARVRNSDLMRGKSSGYRVIYFIRTEDKIVFLSIYIKNEHSDVRPNQVMSWINALGKPNEEE